MIEVSLRQEISGHKARVPNSVNPRLSKNSRPTGHPERRHLQYVLTRTGLRWGG